MAQTYTRDQEWALTQGKAVWRKLHIEFQNMRIRVHRRKIWSLLSRNLHFCDSTWGEGKQHKAKTWSRPNAHIATDFWIVGTWCTQYFKNWRVCLKTSKSFKGNHSCHDMASQAVSAAAIAINCWRPRGGNFKLCSIGNPYWLAVSCSLALGSAASWNILANLVAFCRVSAGNCWSHFFSLGSEIPLSGYCFKTGPGACNNSWTVIGDFSSENWEIWSSSTSRGEAELVFVCDAKTVASFGWPEAWGGVALALARRLGYCQELTSHVCELRNVQEKPHELMLIFQLRPLPILSTVLPKIELGAMPSHLDVPVEFVLTHQQRNEINRSSLLWRDGGCRSLVRCKCSATESISKLASRTLEKLTDENTLSNWASGG